MQKGLKRLFMLCVACLMFSRISTEHQDLKLSEFKFRQVMRLSVGSQEGQLFVRADPMAVFVPKLLQTDIEGNFWIAGEAKGGIMKVKRSREVVTILRPPPFVNLSVNSSGYLAIHVRKVKGYNYTDEIQIYNPLGQKLASFRVNGCPQCQHPYLHYLAGIDDYQQRVWLQFLSTDRTVEEEPKRSACIAAFNPEGKIVHHISGVWGLSAGRLWRRTKSIGGGFIILDPETMKTSEIPVPTGWQGVWLYGIDPNRELIWWDCWRLDDVKVQALMAFGKQGIAAILPIPNKFLGAEEGKEILSYQVVIGRDGRLYVAQCTKEAFYIFEADMSFLKQ